MKYVALILLAGCFFLGGCGRSSAPVPPEGSVYAGK